MTDRIERGRRRKVRNSSRHLETNSGFGNPKELTEYETVAEKEMKGDTKSHQARSLSPSPQHIFCADLRRFDPPELLPPHKSPGPTYDYVLGGK